jgi:hypothetical protein
MTADVPSMQPAGAVPVPRAGGRDPSERGPPQAVPLLCRLLLSEWPPDGDVSASASPLDAVVPFAWEGDTGFAEAFGGAVSTKWKSLRRGAADALGDVRVAGAGRAGAWARGAGGGASGGGSGGATHLECPRLLSIFSHSSPRPHSSL